MSRSNQPNVIVCLCDQLRSFEVGCYGNSAIQTPNIDQLAQQGVRFEIACANNPVCTPSRSILLSGQHSRTGAGALGNQADTPPAQERIRLTDPTLPEIYRNAGYDTALIGKWHVHPDPGVLGFEETLYPHHNHRNTGQTYFKNSGPGFVVDDFAPDYEIDQVRRYVHEQKDQPFFLFYNISPPHMPLADAPEKYTQMYDRDTVPLRDNVWIDGQMAHDEDWFKIYLWDYLYYRHHLPYTENLPENFDLRDLTALYYGLTTCVDDKVGELMQLLEDAGISDNTILLFTSDHGDNLGSHHQFNKGRLIEESIRIPMVYSWPGNFGPLHQTTQVASTVDILPTLCGLSGIEIPATAQGTDLSPAIKGKVETVNESAAYIETRPGEIGIRTATHLYGIQLGGKESDGASRPVENDRHMFYDLREDPFEFNNLSETSVQADLAADLRERVLLWNRETPWKQF
ncbi:MAG: sulfatase-like hydrolase/transferase [Candidatus Latescibacteria bacterium]|jgi:choline-sulfatase|nr:sulfatase-like hydrolase/transferase [Candidatus Latescibacterota bacterium]